MLRCGQVKWEGERRVPDPVQLARTAAIVDEGLAHCSDNMQLRHLRAMVQLSQGDAPAAEAAMRQLVPPLRWIRTPPALCLVVPTSWGGGESLARGRGD